MIERQDSKEINIGGEIAGKKTIPKKKLWWVLWFLTLLSWKLYEENLFKLILKTELLIQIIEKSYFHKKISWVSDNIYELFLSDMYKNDNYFQVDKNFKGGIILKGLPRQNFNILKSLFYYLNSWETITINIYPPEKYGVYKSSQSLTGTQKLETKEDNKSIYSWSSYLQLIINFNDYNPILLNKRIGNYLNDIWCDFLGMRIWWGKMSRYINTSLWFWLNLLKNEWAFEDERLRQNLLF